MRQTRKARAWLLATLVVGSSSFAETMYVTDKLILGVYANSDGSGEQLRIIRSGAKLEVMERVGRYAKIQTDDGDEGWVKVQYLVSEPPAVLLVDELQTQLDALDSMRSEDPDTLQVRTLELENQLAQRNEQLQAAQQQGSTLQQELDLARDALAVAQAQAAAAEKRATEAEQKAQAAARPPPPKPAPTPMAAMPRPAENIGERINSFAQLALVGVALVLLGMFLGYKGLDLYIRRQHGGYRVW